MDKKTYRLLPAWDPVLRFLHWWIVAAVTIMLFTGAVFMIAGHHLKEDTHQLLTILHAMTGFLLGAGLLARIVWLFMGPETARWTDMLPLSDHNRRVFVDTIRFYLRGLRGSPPLYLAHNAFAGPIYLAFFALAAVQVTSGSVLLGLSEKMRHGALSHELHENVFFLILLYIAAHLTAVFVHELAEGHGIVSAMIHGRKTFTHSESEEILKAHPLAEEGEFDERED